MVATVFCFLLVTSAAKCPDWTWFLPVMADMPHVKQILVTILRQRPKHRLSRTQTHLGRW